MRAFHSDEKIKQKYVTRVDAHIKADNLIRGQGWENGKGCAVGCTLESYNHAQYELELGIPEWLARVEDTLFEGMNEEKSKTWPKVFLEAITPGAYLEKAKTPFILVILECNLKTLDSLVVNENYKDVIAAIEQTKDATKQVIHAHKNGLDLSAAESAAWSAAWSAAKSAESAAWSAAKSAESAAWSAAWSAAKSAAIDFYADALIKILQDIKGDL